MDPCEKYDMNFNEAAPARVLTTSPGRYADNGSGRAGAFSVSPGRGRGRCVNRLKQEIMERGSSRSMRVPWIGSRRGSVGLSGWTKPHLDKFSYAPCFSYVAIA